MRMMSFREYPNSVFFCKQQQEGVTSQCMLPGCCCLDNRLEHHASAQRTSSM